MEMFNMDDVYHFFRADRARKFIGTRGYFADCAITLRKNIMMGAVSTLTYISADGFFKDSNDRWHAFFIPEDKVHVPTEAEIQEECRNFVGALGVLIEN